jgi:hypothetical protein
MHVLHSRLLRPPGHRESAGASSSSSAAAAAAAAADTAVQAQEDNYSERTRQQIAQR